MYLMKNQRCTPKQEWWIQIRRDPNQHNYIQQWIKLLNITFKLETFLGEKTPNSFPVPQIQTFSIHVTVGYTYVHGSFSKVLV